MPTIALYSPLSDWKLGDYPTSPMVHVSLSTYSEQSGVILLSAQLMTDKEVDDTIDRLKSELESVRNLAKKELKKILARQLTK